jgi:hypothetical protein
MAFFSDNLLTSSRSKLKKSSVTARRDKTEYVDSSIVNLLDHAPTCDSEDSLPPGVRLVIISDTHGRHEGEEHTMYGQL